MATERARLDTLGEDELDHPDLTQQVGLAHRFPATIDQGERRHLAKPA
jgi:hypothetical protein